MATQREKAIEWMMENPKALELFEQFAKELADLGRKFGINLIRERVRWEKVSTTGGDYKMPNDHCPYIARYLLGKHPTWSQYMACRLTQDENDTIRPVYLPELAVS